VALTAELVACDTTAREGPVPARDEEKLQRVLAARLEALGAAPELWEPEPTGDGDRFLPAGLDFAGRPQLVATLPGTGRGRSLLLNGHIDAVDVEPRERWTSDPFVCVERDGALYGRGVNDMKGGIACLVVALETLRRLDVRLAGDVVFCTVTDEESSGAGGRRAVEHGVRADAGISAEPTDFAAWVSCRGTVTPTITIEGRAGHAEMRQPHWREGGAVNAIERLVPLLQAVQRLREDWRTRPDQQHPLLSPGDIVPTVVKGGSWIVTYPASCELTCDAMYRRSVAARPPAAVELVLRRRAGRDAGRPPAGHDRPGVRRGGRPLWRRSRPRQLARRRHLHARRYADLQLRPRRHGERARGRRARDRRGDARLHDRHRLDRAALVRHRRMTPKTRARRSG